MKLSDLLVDDWVALPSSASDLEGALRALLLRVYQAGFVDEAGALKLAEALARGEAGEISRINDEVLVVLGSLKGLDGPSVALCVTDRPFRVGGEATAGAEEETARAVALVLVPGSVAGARQGILPPLARALKNRDRTGRLLRARSGDEVPIIREILATETVPNRLRVEDALVPVQYRVYPDTPLDEVVDLIVRRGVHAVPVVGEGYEVLGILTSGDALKHLVGEVRAGDDRGRPGPPEDPRKARDVMTRSVMCVSEEQDLVEAANMMVNRDVDQLPVVREGELVGFVTRESILSALHGVLEPRDEQENEQDP